jgi:hypothetical protein
MEIQLAFFIPKIKRNKQQAAILELGIAYCAVHRVHDGAGKK